MATAGPAVRSIGKKLKNAWDGFSRPPDPEKVKSDYRRPMPRQDTDQIRAGPARLQPARHARLARSGMASVSSLRSMALPDAGSRRLHDRGSRFRETRSAGSRKMAGGRWQRRRQPLLGTRFLGHIPAGDRVPMDFIQNYFPLCFLGSVCVKINHWRGGLVRTSYAKSIPFNILFLSNHMASPSRPLIDGCLDVSQRRGHRPHREDSLGRRALLRFDRRGYYRLGRYHRAHRRRANNRCADRVHGGFYTGLIVAGAVEGFVKPFLCRIVVDDPIRAARVAVGSEGFLTTNSKDGEAGPASP